MTELRCDALQLKRGRREVLKRVSFTQAEPALVGLLGPNGAGKTTLMRCVAGLQALDQGAVWLGGQDMSRVDVQTRARHMAYLPQERIVHWKLKVRDVVMLGRLPYQRHIALPDARDQQAVSEAMAAMEVSAFAERAFNQLSGGEQARVLIARTLAQAPKVLLADEPVNGLDPEHQLGLMQTFQHIVARGTTVLTSLHDLGLAARFCQRILLLQDGHLVADGPPAQVLSAEILSEVYRVKVDVRHVEGQLLITPLATLSAKA